MAEKKGQTEELSVALWELLKRNPEAKKEYEEGIQSFRKNYADWGDVFLDECDDFLKNTMQRPAVTKYYHFAHFTFKHPEFFTKMSDDEINKKWMQMLIENSKLIFERLIMGEPVKTLFVGIDLTRSKEAILAELETIISETQDFYWGEELRPRQSWLKKIKDYLAVWDMWIERGEPARQAFPEMAKELKIPESTVRARWDRAYELIYKKTYENDPLKRREDKIEKALKELCGVCTNPTCYKDGDFIGCPEYIRIVGKSASQESASRDSRESAYDNFDEILEASQNPMAVRKNPSRDT